MLLSNFKTYLNVNKFDVEGVKHEAFQGICDEFTGYVEKLNLPNLWCEDKFLELEIKKSLLRSFVRYSIFSAELGLSLLKSDNIYISAPYPMIHLSCDQSETGGGYHVDQVGKGYFQSIWIPITKYSYPGLSYVKYGYIKHLLNKLRILNFSYKENPINISEHSIYTWNGYFFHRGNKNISKDIAAALVIKRTARPLMFEPTLSKSSLGQQKIYTREEVLAIEKFINDVVRFVETSRFHALNADALSDVMRYLEDSSNHQEIANLQSGKKLASFAISLLAQRIDNYPMKGKMPYLNCEVLHMISLLLGAENLASLKRVSYTQDFDSIKFQLFEKLNHFPAYDSYQWHATLGDVRDLTSTKIWS